MKPRRARLLTPVVLVALGAGVLSASCGGAGGTRPTPTTDAGGPLPDDCQVSQTFDYDTDPTCLIPDYQMPSMGTSFYTNAYDLTLTTGPQMDACLTQICPDQQASSYTFGNSNPPTTPLDGDDPCSPHEPARCGESTDALRITLKNATGYGVVLGHPFQNSAGNPVPCDASAWEGVSFWARIGQGKLGENEVANPNVGAALFVGIADAATYDPPTGYTVGSGPITNGAAGDCGMPCPPMQPANADSCTEVGETCQFDETTQAICRDFSVIGSAEMSCCNDAGGNCGQCNCTAAGWQCQTCPVTQPTEGTACTATVAEGDICTYALPGMIPPPNLCDPPLGPANNIRCACLGGQWQCGLVSTSIDACDRHGATVALSTEWHFYTLSFEEIEQRGYGQVSPLLDTQHLLDVAFYFDAGGGQGSGVVGTYVTDWDIWLDKVAFYRKKP